MNPFKHIIDFSEEIDILDEFRDLESLADDDPELLEKYISELDQNELYIIDQLLDI